MAFPLAYHWRSLFTRKTTTFLTILVISAVVAVLAWMGGFLQAMRTSFSVAGDEQKIIVLREGATAESNSVIPVEEFNKLTQLRGVARDSVGGDPLISPELMVQVSLPRIRDGGKTNANVAVRGVTDKAFRVHTNVKPRGKVFSPGALEVIVGASAAEQFQGLRIGDSIRLGYGGDRTYKVVGYFAAAGGPMESEIWAYLPSLKDSYARTMYSSAFLRLAEGEDARRTMEEIRGPAIRLSAVTEAQYWREQSGTFWFYLVVVYFFVGVMCLAALFAIANTMFAFVAGRSREIAMLRTIGFSRRRILVGFLVESVLLSLLGGVLGCAACAAWLWLVGNTKDMFGANTFTTLAFEISLKGWIIPAALTCVAFVGLIGAVFPARRAAATQVVSALREP